MKKSGYTAEQVAFALRQTEAGMGVAEARKLRILEEENRKLKQLVADISLDKQLHLKWTL